MQHKVFVVGGDISVVRMFMDNNWKIVHTPEEADLIQFTGGEDVSPMLYGEPRHPTTGCNPARDQKEANIFFSFPDKPKAGICRGGQFLNVMSGGFMHQDVDNHAIAGTHLATYEEDGNVQEVSVTSTHHQMMQPDVGSFVFLSCNRSNYKENGWQEDVKETWPTDVEGVMYFETNSLCFQPHPEYVDPEHECQRLYFRVLERFFGFKE
jgi:gamma-glutamyl-gamma-aminobutyrate hydrolase PuuD